MPRLVTKLPEGKDPVICVCFEKEMDAEKTNEDLVNYAKGDKYAVKIWPTDQGRLLNLMIISLNKETKRERIYKNLSFDYHKLEWWLRYTENSNVSLYKFAHITDESGKHKVAKTLGAKKNFVLNVVSCQVNEFQEFVF